MSALSKKLRAGADNALMFWCPGCHEAHRITHGAGSGPRWGWNGDPESPTFTPSILVRTIRSPRASEHMTEEEGAEYDALFAAGGLGAVFASRFGWICHSFVMGGKIQFLCDCTHALAGQTVDLPEWPE